MYTSAVFNFVPQLPMDFYHAIAREDQVAVSKMIDDFFLPYPDIRNRKAGYAVSIVKAGAKISGYDAGPVRTPLTGLTPQEYEIHAALMDKQRNRYPLVISKPRSFSRLWDRYATPCKGEALALYRRCRERRNTCTGNAQPNAVAHCAPVIACNAFFLEQQEWRGNIRHLEQAVHLAVALADQGFLILRTVCGGKWDGNAARNR